MSYLPNMQKQIESAITNARNTTVDCGRHCFMISIATFREHLLLKVPGLTIVHRRDCTPIE